MKNFRLFLSVMMVVSSSPVWSQFVGPHPVIVKPEDQNQGPNPGPGHEQVPNPGPPPVVPPPVEVSAPSKPETKTEYLLRLSGLRNFESLADDIYGKELSEKTDVFTKEQMPLVLAAGAKTAKGYNAQSKLVSGLDAALSIRDQKEVEEFFKDPRVQIIMTMVKKNQDDYDKIANGVYGEFIQTYLQTQSPNTPRRAYLYFIDQELTHRTDLTLLQMRIENLIKMETGNLGIAKAKKKDMGAEMAHFAQRIAPVHTEQILDEISYFYKDITTDELKWFLSRIRTPGVAKFYSTYYHTISDSALELAKKFVLNLKEVHRDKLRQNI